MPTDKKTQREKQKMNQRDKVLCMTPEQLKTWVNDNLIRASEAMEITEQSKPAFNQAVRDGQLEPFYSNGIGGGGFGTINLYLKSEVEVYAGRVKERRQRLLKKNE